MTCRMQAAAMSEAAIPLVDLRAQYENHAPEFDAALRRVVESGVFIGGPEHEAFAREFAEWCGGGHVALVGNGTDALTLAILELLGPGDGRGEIVTMSHTFVATAEAICNAGYRPAFVDIEPKTCLMSIPALEAAIGPASRAIIPVHLYGQMVDMRALRAIAERHRLPVIEDAAQAHGARFDGAAPGCLSAAACYSFYPGKNIGAWGDGGAVFTKNADLAARIAKRANHGRSGKYLHESQGVNSRLDAVQAAVLRVKLRHADEWNAARRRAASWYAESLSAEEAIVRPMVDPRAEHVYHLYVVQVADRDCVKERLAAEGVATGTHYPVPVHEQPAFADLGYAPQDLPVTWAAARRVLSLPMYPEITRAQVERVASALIEAVRS